MLTGESEKVQEFGEERKVAEAGTAYSTLQVQGTSCCLYTATIRLLVGRNSTMTKSFKKYVHIDISQRYGE